MAVDLLIYAAVVLLLGCGGIVLIALSGVRRSQDVLDGLRDERKGAEAGAENEASRGNYQVLTDRLGKIGLYEAGERRAFVLQERLMPFVFALVLSIARPPFFGFSAEGTVITALIGLCLGYLAAQARYRKRKRQFVRLVEFYLPVVMERIVMAVEAGLDIVPAMRALIELDTTPQEKRDNSAGGMGVASHVDPVTRLLSVVLELTEAGLRLEDALRDVASTVGSPSLRHAFIHLSVAQQEGGELIAPLRELSDATQLYYQETVEEEIATMPVRATAPLLCTFAGLILFFITTPLIQVMETFLKSNMR